MRLIAENFLASPTWLRVIEAGLFGFILFAMAMRVYCFWDDTRGRA